MSIEVTECVAHPSGPGEPDCEFCATETAQLTKVLDSRVQSNRTKSQKLATLGAMADPIQVISMRINILLGILFGERGTKNRVRFEVTFQDELANLLDNIMKEAAMAKLTQGIKQPMPPFGGR